MRGKAHHLGSVKDGSGFRRSFVPGEAIHTDHLGPWMRSREGFKYLQIFVDVATLRLWVRGMPQKTGAYDALRDVLSEAKVRSGRPAKFVKSDGDGVFGRSAEFQEIQKNFGFIHERSAPYDHNQNAIVERMCRSVLEGIQTSLEGSGAPPSFWFEAACHFAFTRNHRPRVPIESKKGQQEYWSTNEAFEGARNPISAKHFVAFGTQVTCCKPKETRDDQKGPGQAKVFDGILLGYVQDMRAYRVWDIKKKKVKEISYNFTVVSEGFYPFRNQVFRGIRDLEPATFFPTKEILSDRKELGRYQFSSEEVDLVRKLVSPFDPSVGPEHTTHTSLPTHPFVRIERSRKISCGPSDSSRRTVKRGPAMCLVR